jgi:hypothetical protein
VEISGGFDSIVVVGRTEVYMNGVVNETGPGGRHGELYKRAPVLHSGWLMRRALINQAHYPVGDPHVVAETSPIQIFCGDEPILRSSTQSIFIHSIDDITRQPEVHPALRSEKEKKHVIDPFAEARRIFEQRAWEAKQ